MPPFKLIKIKSMKTRIYLLTIVLTIFLAGCKEEKVKQYSIEQFMNNTNIAGSTFSADESTIAFTSDESGIYNAYAISLENKSKSQLTDRKESTSVISYFPDDNRILLSSDKGGNEIYHIYLKEENGEIRDLIPFEGARVIYKEWAKDKKSFFFISNKRDPRYMDLYEMDISSFNYKLIYENTDGYNIGPISDDKTLLALSKTISRVNNNMFLYHFKTDEITLLSEHEGDVLTYPIEFESNGKLLYLTDKDNEFRYLAKMDIETLESTQVYDPGWDILYAYNSYNDKYRVIGINQDSRTVVKIIDLNTEKELDLPKFSDLDITSVNISKSETKMAFYASSSKTPKNLYIYNFGNQQYEQLTNTLNPEINPDHLVEGKVVRYKSFDGLEIPAILYIPQNASEKNKVPALVNVHGGPGGQARIGYRARIQYLVNHGYAIIDVNNRGSSGYGKTFYSLDDRKHGNHDLKDCIYAKDYLINTGMIDSTKIGIIGGSYGGYMVAAAMTFTPEEFKVGVNLYGVTNWIRTLKSIPSWWESMREALYKELGNPYTDSAYLYEISPLFHAEKIKNPIMVLQGSNDPRVLKIESDEIVETVKKNNVPVEYVIFEDEGHGFRKKANQVKAYESILEFLDKYLKEETKETAE